MKSVNDNKTCDYLVVEHFLAEKVSSRLVLVLD